MASTGSPMSASCRRSTSRSGSWRSRRWRRAARSSWPPRAGCASWCRQATPSGCASARRIRARWRRAAERVLEDDALRARLAEAGRHHAAAVRLGRGRPPDRRRLRRGCRSAAAGRVAAGHRRLSIRLRLAPSLDHRASGDAAGHHRVGADHGARPDVGAAERDRVCGEARAVAERRRPLDVRPRADHAGARRRRPGRAAHATPARRRARAAPTRTSPPSASTRAPSPSAAPAPTPRTQPGAARNTTPRPIRTPAPRRTRGRRRRATSARRSPGPAAAARRRRRPRCASRG